MRGLYERHADFVFDIRDAGDYVLWIRGQQDQRDYGLCAYTRASCLHLTLSAPSN